MLNLNTGYRTAACLAASVLMGVSASAQTIIYDNSEFNLGQRTDAGNAEVGDVVTFAGTDRILTSFQLEYFVSDTVSGNEMAQVFLRALDGPVLPDGTLLPGTTLYDSGAFNITSGYHTFNANNLSLDVPDSLAWTVVFSGLGDLEGEGAGLLFYGSPTVGESPTFPHPVTTAPTSYTLLRTDATGWQLVDHPGVQDNLAARFTAVPEPTTWALLLGGLATLGLIRRRKA